MALQLRSGGGGVLSQWSPQPLCDSNNHSRNRNGRSVVAVADTRRRSRFPGLVHCSSSGRSSNNGSSDAKKGVPNSNYVVPLNKSFSPSNSSYITRPLVEILRDLNKRIPDNVVKPPSNSSSSTLIPWYHANRMLSFYAPGWCGEVRDVIFAENGTITVVYRLTIRGSDGEAHRESTGTVSSSSIGIGEDPVSAAEEIAFCRACARFGLGLYLYHEEQ
ncbi:hypothetical protein V6N13_145410 [Hibiscus sabdariffa]|uniref:DNA repair RAD52-like protein 2, chloroplastic n=1 Tax=Hibiscus sabdariffa TaxID=183260 RepID=A0ABR2TPI6_9ROSI